MEIRCNDEERLQCWVNFISDLRVMVGEGCVKGERSIFSSLLALSQRELYFGYPGECLLNDLLMYVKKWDWDAALSITIGVVDALESKSFRRVKAQSCSDFFGTKTGVEGGSGYFEVLIFCNDKIYQDKFIEQYSTITWERDDFLYNYIFVNSIKDAVDSLKVNYDVLACIVVDGDANERNRDSIVLEGSRLVERLKSIRSDVSFLLVSDDSIVRGGDPEESRNLRKGQSFYDLHYHLVKTVRNLYCTPFFDALREYSKKPTTSFHALPISKAASIRNSRWANDFYHFYGEEVFSAETSSTLGGLDSLLEPRGPIKQACDKAAQTFGALDTFFVTSGTSTSNKIVLQANLNPGDIVLVGADCHKSIPSSIVMTGADVIYLETYPLEEYDLYGAVRLAEVLSVLGQLYQGNQLHRVKQISLTNCTFDGVLYNVELFMMSILAIKPDVVFHWDEAWFAHGHFHRQYSGCSAMKAAKSIERKVSSEEYQKSYREKRNSHEASASWIPHLPDPEKVLIRVYATQSTHKSLTAFRQAAMIHIYDRAFDRGRFVDAYRMHTTTSPAYQNIASLDIARRQVSLEGYRLTDQSIQLANRLRDTINTRSDLTRCFSALDWQDLVGDACGLSLSNNLVADRQNQEFFCDPTRVLLDVSLTGMGGSLFREILMTRFNIQVNKSSKNTVLFIINIGVSENDIDYLLMVLNTISESVCTTCSDEKERLSMEMPSQRIYSERYRGFTGRTHQALQLRSAYYDTRSSKSICFVILGYGLIESIEQGREYVSASFVTPYPPGYPVLLPGQVITSEVVKYLMSLKIREIHGYDEQKGLKVFVPTDVSGNQIDFVKRLSEVSCEVN